MKFHLVTYGCQMNKADSEAIAGLLTAAGHKPASGIAQANLIVFNTCSVRQRAENRLYGNLSALGKAKKAHSRLVVAVGGCVAEKEREGLLKRFPAVDLIFGTRSFARLPRMIEEYEQAGARQSDLSAAQSHLRQLPSVRKQRRRAWLPIIRGCNNFCSYCIVPYTRGREMSRPLPEVLSEAHRLAEEGVKEITLLGQNVNSYGKDLDRPDLFPELLRRLNQIESVKRIRFITSHPKDLSQETIRVVAQADRVCEHFHLPLQSGSNRILESMRRGYTREQYFDLIAAIRDAVPASAITTDLIVGFPGEREDDFEETLEAMSRVRFDQAFTAMYSPRPGTSSAKLSDDVPPGVKRERLDRVNRLHEQQALVLNRALVGATVEAFVEGESRKGKTLCGRTRTNKIINFPGEPRLIDTFIPIRIREATAYSLKGVPCGEIGDTPARNWPKPLRSTGEQKT